MRDIRVPQYRLLVSVPPNVGQKRVVASRPIHLRPSVSGYQITECIQGPCRDPVRVSFLLVTDVCLLISFLFRNDPELYLYKDMAVRTFVDYLTTFSGYREFKTRYPRERLLEETRAK